MWIPNTMVQNEGKGLYVTTSSWLWRNYIHWSWRRPEMGTFSALLALCAGNSEVTGELPSQMPVTQSFDVFFGLRLNKLLSKSSRRRWFETPSRSLWRHCNVILNHIPSQNSSVHKWTSFFINLRYWFNQCIFNNTSSATYSINGKTSYRKISWSSEAGRSIVLIGVLFGICQAAAS